VVSVDEPKEQFIAGSCVLSVLSLANCAAASYSRHLPLYKHVASLLSADGQVIIVVFEYSLTGVSDTSTQLIYSAHTHSYSIAQ
jgi:enolase